MPVHNCEIAQRFATLADLLEIDVQPARLDLNDTHCRMVKEAGVKVSVSIDAHSTANLANLRFGVDQARSGRLEPDDVLNTMPLDELRRALRR